MTADLGPTERPHDHLRVTVIIPCLDVERLVVRAVRSCLEQEVAPAEILCIDDGSSDGTVGVLQALAREHPSVRILENTERLGPGGSRNRGLDEAAGDVIVLVDADDALLPGALERIVATMSSDDLDLLLLSAEQQDAGERADRGCSYRRAFGDTAGRLLTRPELREALLQVRFAPWHKAYRRAFLDRHRIRFPERVLYEDLPFHVDCFALAERVAYVDADLYVHERGRPEAVTTAASERTLTAWEAFAEAERRVVQHWPADLLLHREFDAFRISKMLAYTARLPSELQAEHLDRVARSVLADGCLATRTVSRRHHRMLVDLAHAEPDDRDPDEVVRLGRRMRRDRRRRGALDQAPPGLVGSGAAPDPDPGLSWAHSASLALLGGIAGRSRRRGRRVCVIDPGGRFAGEAASAFAGLQQHEGMRLTWISRSSESRRHVARRGGAAHAPRSVRGLAALLRAGVVIEQARTAPPDRLTVAAATGSRRVLLVQPDVVEEPLAEVRLAFASREPVDLVRYPDAATAGHLGDVIATRSTVVGTSLRLDRGERCPCTAGWFGSLPKGRLQDGRARVLLQPRRASGDGRTAEQRWVRPGALKALLGEGVRIILVADADEVDAYGQLPGAVKVVERGSDLVRRLLRADVLVTDSSSAASDARTLGIPVVRYVPDVDRVVRSTDVLEETRVELLTGEVARTSAELRAAILRALDRPAVVGQDAVCSHRTLAEEVEGLLR